LSLTFHTGRNECGQLGHGDRLRYDVPKIIDSLQPYTVVGGACGRNHTLCLTDDGVVFAFGENTLGQLGLGEFYWLYCESVLCILIAS